MPSLVRTVPCGVFDKGEEFSQLLEQPTHVDVYIVVGSCHEPRSICTAQFRPILGHSRRIELIVTEVADETESEVDRENVIVVWNAHYLTAFRI